MAQPEAFGLINAFGALGQLAVNRVRRHFPTLARRERRQRHGEPSTSVPRRPILIIMSGDGPTRPYPRLWLPDIDQPIQAMRHELAGTWQGAEAANPERRG
jgi:hypothetical protein